MFNLADKSRPITVWGYGRASTHKQELTPIVQEEAIRKAFDAYRMLGQIHPDSTFGGFYCDAAESSKTPFFKRPNGDFICGHVEPGDCIIVSKYDRLFRSVVDFCETMESLMARNIRLIMLDWNLDTSTVNGYGMAQILAVVKWMEREACRERTREAVQQNIKSGRPHSAGTVIGYKKVYSRENGCGKRKSYFVIDERCRALCDLITHRHDELKHSFEKITLDLEREGYRQTNPGRQFGKPYSYKQVWARYQAKQDKYPIYGIVHETLPTVPKNVYSRENNELDRRIAAAMNDVA